MRLWTVLAVILASVLFLPSAGAEARIETGVSRQGAPGASGVGMSAYVADRQGEAWWHWDGENARRDLFPGQALPAGVWVRTGENGWIALQLPGGHGIIVEGNTHLFLPGWGAAGTTPDRLLRDIALSEGGGRVQWVRLELGKIWVDVVQRVSRLFHFEVITPSAVAGVRGTFFSVSVEPDGTTRVWVVRGRVRVSGRRGAVELAPDTATTVKSEGAPSAPAGEDAGQVLVPDRVRQILEERLHHGADGARWLGSPGGWGIPEAVREKLRERFAHLPQVASKLPPGLGREPRPLLVYGKGGSEIGKPDEEEAEGGRSKRRPSVGPGNPGKPDPGEKPGKGPKGPGGKKGGPPPKKGVGKGKGKPGGKGK